eukprot:CAMPEP_0119037878 /NCGR_PEP_ID=MMETSP1177-20130426/6418_1 /TAXON_ID=2985 /ORGANISM="Ochromonas sp, Strain CCMP1899" /LENGTH=41 /DNA_ID= /DNA_START= /DNA_END= /DNA_ORIENTATION=
MYANPNGTVLSPNAVLYVVSMTTRPAEGTGAVPIDPKVAMI